MISESENIRLIAQMGAERERASHRSKICHSCRNSAGECPLCAKSGHPTRLFDHLVGMREQSRRYVKAERFGRL